MAESSNAVNWFGRILVLIVVLVVVVWVLVPNVPREPRRSPMTNALSEVKNAETAFTGMLSDAQVNDFSSFFNPDAFTEVHADVMQRESLNAFDASVQMYSVAFMAFLRQGKNAASALADSDIEGMDRILDSDCVRKLGTSYMELDEDPWGQPYRFFVGPWPWDWGPPVLRIRQRQDVAGAPTPDALTIDLAGGQTVGYLAPANVPIYIWCLGENGVCDQAIFDPAGVYAAPAREHYRSDAENKYLGGGDDINNWDPGQSWHPLYARKVGKFGCR